MSKTSRRRLLAAGFGVAFGAFAGCLGTGERSDSGSPSAALTTNGPTSLTEWERSTDCDSMHDSVVRVERVTAELGDGYAPIRFESLSDGEKRILRAVTEEGGYGTCDSSGAFQRFVERVSEHGTRQEADGMRVSLERNGTFYGLYVEKLDQVYAY